MAGATVTFGSTSSDQRGGSEQHDHHGHDSGGERGRGDGDGDSERAEWEPGQCLYLRSAADGEQRAPEQRVDGGRNGGDDHRDELWAGATVTFGSTAATNVVVVNGTTITATTPAGSAGAVTVTVTNSSGLSGSLASAFTFVVPPTVTSVSPNSGTTAGGTAVTITGTNFALGSDRGRLGLRAAATNVVVVNSTTITATTPAGTAGAVTVTVTVNGQSGSLANGFTYVVAPTVTSVSPEQGYDAGGTAVTITGTNFASGATVTFGSAAATNVVVVNSTIDHSDNSGGQCRCSDGDGDGERAEWEPGEWVHLCCAADGDQRQSRIADRPAGGTAVTITGTNFVAGATVTFGAAAATNVVVVSSTIDHGDHSSRQCRRGDGHGDQCWVAKRKLGQRIHLCGCALGEQCQSEQRADGGWNGGNDHRDELCHGRDGEVRQYGGNQCGGGEQHDDHGYDSGGECRRGDGNGDGERAEREPGEWVHLCCAADGDKRQSQ